MDSKKPEEIVADLISIGEHKTHYSVGSILLKGVQSGALLGISTVLAFTVAIQSGMYFIGALAFPVGFAMIILLGYELVTSNFAVVPMALLDKRISTKDLMYSWFWAFTGNLIGSLFFGGLFFIYITKLGVTFDADVIAKVVEVAESKTIAYKAMGATGLIIVFTKAFLCNWMVTMGMVMGTSSKSSIGRILALWLPIFTFFALGLEHSVVNMFVIPAGIMFQADVTISDWWLWNQIPATIGNIAGGFLMTGLTLYMAYGRKQA